METKGHIITDEQFIEYNRLVENQETRTVLVDMVDYSHDHWYSVSKFMITLSSDKNNKDLDTLQDRLRSHERNVFNIIKEANEREPRISMQWRNKRDKLAVEVGNLKKELESLKSHKKLYHLIMDWYKARKSSYEE